MIKSPKTSPPIPTEEEKRNETQWNDTRARLKKRWSKLKHLDIESLRDNLSLLSGQLEKRYGFSDEFAKHESDNFIKKIKFDKTEKQIVKDYPNIDEMKTHPQRFEDFG